MESRFLCHTWGLACFPAELQGGDHGDGGDVPDLVHLVAQLGSVLDPKCDTKIKMPYLTGIQW